MRLAVCLLSLTSLAAVHLKAANIEYQVTAIGPNSLGQTQYRYSYFVSDIAFAVNQELDIQFDPTLFGQLSNGTASPDFDLLLLQPNNPPQAQGDYSALALVNQPSLAGPFSVDFTYLGQGTPGAQSFFINQYTPDGAFQEIVTSGSTTPLSVSEVPEPLSVSLCWMGLLAGCARWISMRPQSLNRNKLDQQ